MSKKSDFEVFDIMSKQNMDIACCIDQISFDRVKNKGGKVTFGVPEPHFTNLINQAATGDTTHYAIVYIVNKEQFNKIKKED